MKKTLLTAFCAVILCITTYAQQVSPSGIYGAAKSSTAGGLTVNWVLGSLTPITISALPVKLISFKGNLTNAGDAELIWKTSQESGNKGFEIQKSVDGRIFEAIGWVDGGGDREGEKVYHFLDHELATTSYYRLRQVDFDEKFTLSKIISVIPSNESLDRFTAYPNPSQDGKPQITVPDNAISLTLIDHQGVIISKQKNPSNGQILTLPKTGMYLLRLQTAVGEKIMKLVRN